MAGVFYNGVSMQYDEVLKELKVLSNPSILNSMKKFGINTEKAYGVSIPNLRKLAKKIGKDHNLALQLWSSDIHETKILASMVDNPTQVSDGQMEKWVKDLNSWDLCDNCCGNLFDKTKFAYRKAVEWSKRNEEFVKRAGFALMATLSVHDKKAKDENFLKFLPIIKRESVDDRNFVKKAVNWALCQIGKRSMKLNKAAIQAAKEIQKIDSKSAKWTASNALRELTSESIRKRLC